MSLQTMRCHQGVPLFGVSLDERIKTIQQEIKTILASGDPEAISRLHQNIRTLTGGIIDHEQSHEQSIKEHLFRNILHAKNLIAIYEGDELIFANLAWERITEYTFLEIQEKRAGGEDITEIFYGHSHDELSNVRSKLTGALKDGGGYEDFVCTLETKGGKFIPIAWKNTTYSEKISMREGNIDRAKSIKAEQEYFEFAKNLLHREMSKKDNYTAGHIKRVMKLSLIIAGILNYSTHEIKLTEIQAGLHDDGKNLSDSILLGSPNILTPEQRAKMNTHAGDGVMNAIENNYPPDFILAMFHHDAFYDEDGIIDLIVPALIHGYKNKEITDPNMTNRLVGRNIPTAGRMVAIPDMIDAVASRRLYSQFLARPIEEIIEYIESNILASAGLVLGKNNEVELDPKVWREAITMKELSLPYCISWEEISYIPRIERNDPNHTDYQSKPFRIQFDPLIVKNLYIDGKLHENIKDNLREFDKIYRSDKIIEIKKCLLELEERSANTKEYTDIDYETHARLSLALLKLESSEI